MSIWLDSIYEISGLAVFLAGFVFLAQKKLENGICLAVFLLPLYLLKIKIFFVPLNVLEILIGFLFLLWLFKKKYREIGLSKIREFSLPALLILNGAIFSTLFSQNLAVSAGILKSWFLAPLIFALIIAGEIKTGEQIKKMFRWLAVSSGLVAIAAIFYFLTGRLTFDGRLAAFFLSPNHLAMYLAPGFLLSLALLESGIKKERLFFLALLIVSGSALYLTFSYAAWLAVILAAIFWIFARIKNKKRALIICGLLLIVLLGFLSLLQLNSEKLNNFLHSSRSSWQSRLVIWRASWAIAKDNPVLGIGPGMFQEYYLRYQNQFAVPYLEWAVPQPHNIFLAFWLQTGLLGLAGFLWLIILFFRNTVKLIKQTEAAFFCSGTPPRLHASEGSNSPRPFTNTIFNGARCENAAHASGQFLLILATLMTYILLHGLIDTTYFKNDLSVVFWIIIALCVPLLGVAGARAD